MGKYGFAIKAKTCGKTGKCGEKGDMHKRESVIERPCDSDIALEECNGDIKRGM